MAIIEDKITETSLVEKRQNSKKSDTSKLKKRHEKFVKSKGDFANNPKHLNVIRPKGLSDIIGREDVVKKIRILTRSAQERGDILDHILFYGPPGIGKTSFGYAIANEVGTNFVLTTGAGLKNKAEIASLLTNLNKGDVLFIDEIHRLNKSLEEFLYPVLEDFRLDFSVNSGNIGSTISLDLPKFTLIGATTMVGSLSKPFLDRFGAVIKLELYSVVELVKIIEAYAKINSIKIEQDGIVEIARRSRGTARLALRNFKRCYDLALSNGNIDGISTEEVISTFMEYKIDTYGLDESMREYLGKILNLFDGGPVGAHSLAIALNEDTRTVEEYLEPYLIKLGFIKRTNKGRLITNLGKEYIDKAMKES